MPRENLLGHRVSFALRILLQQKDLCFFGAFSGKGLALPVGRQGTSYP